MVHAAILGLSLALLASGCAFAQSKQEAPQAKSGNQDAATEKRGAESTPGFVKSSSQTSERDATYERYEKEEKPANERRVTSATVALAWITGLLALFTALLWYATYRLSADAKKTAIKQASDTEKSLGIARDTANAAIVSAMPILVPYVIERAAHLYPENPITEPYTPRLSFVFQNFGATPGIVRRVHAGMLLITKDELPPAIDFEALGRVHQEIIVPGRLFENKARIAGSTCECPPFRAITPEEHQMLLNEFSGGKTVQRLYLVGKVIYDDFFGTRHAATFCMKVRRGGYHGQHGGPKFNRITREPIPKENDPFDELPWR